MTLPASGSISLGQVLTELQVTTPSRSLPISLGDTDVRALAGVPSGTIGMSDLYGKSSYTPMTASATSNTQAFNSTGAAGTASSTSTVSVTGGSGGLTYAWNLVSSTGSPTLSNTTSATVTVLHNYAANASGSASAVVNCTVTDNTSHVVTSSNGTVNISWST